ncbi:unnamed protein product [Colias eurytheme]|nr:unnamed protein product [Colias eurytheme]
MKYLAIFLVLALVAIAHGNDVEPAQRIPTSNTNRYGITCNDSPDCAPYCQYLCGGNAISALCYLNACYCGVKLNH